MKITIGTGDHPERYDDAITLIKQWKKEMEDVNYPILRVTK